jgi:hypothetical protein
MSDQAEPQAVFTCFACGCEVPWDEVFIPESVDYMMHFCGLACYAWWRSTAIEIESGRSAPAE